MECVGSPAGVEAQPGRSHEAQFGIGNLPALLFMPGDSMMRLLARLLLVACSVLAAAEASSAQTEERVALVIGNSAYQHTLPLANPRRDAEALADLLRESGFAVTLKTDLDHKAMLDAVRRFGRKAETADVA